MSPPPQPPDYIYTAKYLLCSNTQKSVIEEGGIAVYQDTIIDLGKRSELLAKYPGIKSCHEKNGLIMPGLINCHTHAAMSCFRGLADDIPLMVWLEQHIFPIEARLTAEVVYQFSQLSIAEMIRSGTTSFCDMYPYAKDVGRAAEKAGMRAWIGEAFYDFPSPSFGETENGFSVVDELFDIYQDHNHITATISPHSVYACSAELLCRLGKLSDKHQSLVVIHLSENDEEVKSCLKRYGSRPVEHLENLGLLNERTLGCHCVKLLPHEIELLQKHKVSVVHCIESNMKLASGIAPAVDIIQSGITLALGTDSSASNNNLDMFGEMNSVAKMHKVERMDPTVMGAEETLYAATLGGARALGAEDSIGSLAQGKKADFIVLDLDQPHLIPVYTLPSHLVYAARGSDVQHAFVNGRQLMKNRELLFLDEEKLLYNIEKLSNKISNLRCS